MNRLKRDSLFVRLSIVLMSMVVATSAVGFVILAPVLAYKYLEKDKGYEATAVMPASPDEIYRTAVSAAEEKAPKIRIVKREDENMFLEVTDGIQTAAITVKKTAAEGSSEFTVMATVPGEEGQEKEVQKDREKELAHRIINLMCTKMEVECAIIKE